MWITLPTNFRRVKKSMEDINLLPKDLRHKAEGKITSEKTVGFVYPKKTEASTIEQEDLPKKQNIFLDQNVKQKEQAHGAKDAGNIDAQVQAKPSKIQRALLIFKKIKISDLKKILHQEKDKKAAKPQESGLSVDLLKEAVTLRRSSKPELLKFFIIAAIITLSFVGAMFYYKSKYQHIKADVDGLGLEIQNLNAELADLQAKQASLRDADKLIGAVYVLLKNRVNWLAFLKEIENRTLKTVYYTQLKAEGLNKISITARAKSIEDGLKQINIFKASSEFAQDVVLAEMDIQEEDASKIGGIEDLEEPEKISVSVAEFSFDFTVNPEWIAKNAY